MKRLLILLILLATIGLVRAQDTIIIINPYGFKSLRNPNFSIDSRRGGFPVFFLTKRDVIGSTDSLVIQKMVNYGVLEKELWKEDGTYCVCYDRKGRKIEEGMWLPKTFTGKYIMYHKNGKVRIRGEYDKYGTKKGLWYFYNRKGEVKKKKSYE